MKKFLPLVLAIVACITMCIPAMAEPVEGIEHCYFNYNAYKSTNDVKIDGVYDEAEWADADALTIDADHLIEASRWQCTGDPNPASEFSCTYRFKWDDTYFYVLEVRTDAHYVSDFGDNSYDPNAPWMLDGTAIFFCDNELPDQSNRCDIKWYSYVDQLKGPTASVAGVDITDNPDVQMASTVNGDKVVFELKFPWSIIDDEWKLESPATEGKIFRFTPIIMNRDVAEDYGQWDGSSYRQINFHDCVNIPEEGVTGAEDPNYWAAMTLCGAKPAEETKTEEPVAEPETPAEEPAAEPEAPATEPAETVDTPAETVETPAETAPQTFDAVVISAVAAVVSLAGYAVAKKH